MENNEDLELYVFTDEDGNDVNVQVLDYFYYNGDEYAVMTELAEGQEPWTEAGGDEEAPEIFFMKAFRHSGGMNHIIEMVTLKLLLQCLGVVDAQCDEVYAAVGEEVALAAATNSSPHLHISAQCFFYNERTNKATGSSNENLHYFLNFAAKVVQIE